MVNNPYGPDGEYTKELLALKAKEEREYQKHLRASLWTEEDQFFKDLADEKKYARRLNNPKSSAFRKTFNELQQARVARSKAAYITGIRRGMEDNLMDSMGLGNHKDSIRLLTRKSKGGFKGNLKVLGLRAGTRLLTSLPGMILGAAKSQIDGAGQRQRIGAALDASDNEMQALNFASDRFGADADTLYSAVDNLGAGRDAAISGDRQAQQAFSALGVSKDDLFTKSNVDLFAQLTSQFESGKVSAEQYRAGIALLGEEFQALQPAIENGMGKSIADFQESPLAIDPNTSRSLGELVEGFGMLADLAGKAAGAVSRVVRTITSTAWAAVSKVLAGLVNGAKFLGTFGMAMGANLLAPVSDTAAEFRNHLLDSLQEKEGDETTAKLQKTLDRKKEDRATKEAEQERLTAEKREQQQQKLAQAKELEAENLKRLRARQEAEKPTEEKLTELVSFREGLKNMIQTERDPLRKQQFISADISAEKDEIALRRTLDHERESSLFGYKPPGLDKLARSGIYTSTATADYARQLPDIQRAMLNELRLVTRAVQENTSVVEGAFGGR